MLGALYLLQEQQGYLTANGMRHVAEILEMTPAEVEDVASYYVMFYREPVGKYVLQVCRTLSCALMGAERVTEALSEKLGIKVGETDPSGMFTLMEFECLGACDRAPVVMVNNEHWHENVSPGRCGKAGRRHPHEGRGVVSGCHSRRARMSTWLPVETGGKAEGRRTKRYSERGWGPASTEKSRQACDYRQNRVRHMEPILTKYVREPNSFTLDFYLKHQGYEG